MAGCRAPSARAMDLELVHGAIQKHPSGISAARNPRQ
jgi:hypothetical protein